MAILSALLGANQKAAGYSIAGKQAYNQGLRQRIQKYSEANAAELQASRTLSSAGRNMMTARVNQTAAQGGARAAQAASGFLMDAGSGGRLERQVTEAADKQIADMARTASDQAGSLYNQAYTAQNAGDSAMRLGERTQSIYSQMASRTKTAGWIEAGIDSAIALTSAALGFNDASEANDAANAWNRANGLDEGAPGAMATVNPFQKAFLSGMSNTNGSLLPFLQQSGFAGGYGAGSPDGSYWPYSNRFPSR